MKYEIRSNVENGILKRNRNLLIDAIKSFEGQNVIVTIEKAKKKRSNPIAFPQDANTCLDEFRGMTLRDYAQIKFMSAILKKAETVIFVEKENELTLVNPEYTRNQPFEPFAFAVDSNWLPFVVDYQISDKPINNKEKPKF